MSEHEPWCEREWVERGGTIHLRETYRVPWCVCDCPDPRQGERRDGKERRDWDAAMVDRHWVKDVPTRDSRKTPGRRKGERRDG